MSNIDWSVLEIEGVADIAEAAARKVSAMYDGTLEFEDAQQEALVFLATDGEVTRKYVEDPSLGLGKLHRRLVFDLIDKVKTEARHRATHTSFERAREDEQ